MEIDIEHHLPPPFPYEDPDRVINRSHLELLIGDSFSFMKNRCVASDLSEARMRGLKLDNLQENQLYYSVIPFTEEKLSSPSFNDAKTFPNLIMNDDGMLLQLLFSYSSPSNKDRLPPGHRLIHVTEWRSESGIVARRFNGYM